MTFQKALDQLRVRIEQSADLLDNEEATKLALIFPMIEAWGYNPADPNEIRVEYAVKLAHGGRGRADCVIMRQGRPAIVIECKSVGVELDDSIIQQLRQYVNATGAFIGVATDGIEYRCFADTTEPNRMDETPFLDANLLTCSEADIEALALLSKERFSPEDVRAAAAPYRQQREARSSIRDLLLTSALWNDIEYLGGIANSKQRREAAAEFAEWMQQEVGEIVESIAEDGSPFDDGLILTNDEYDAYLIVRGIVHGTVEPHRVAYRDGRSYFSVLIDDNNRKPVCRLHFNGRIKHVGTFDEDKQETKHPIEDLDDIFNLAARLRRTARRYAES